jgi:hypothetical protein
VQVGLHHHGELLCGTINFIAIQLLLLSAPTGFSDLALLHFGARHGQDCAGDEVGVVDHRHVVNVGQEFERRLGQALARNLAICSNRNE